MILELLSKAQLQILNRRSNLGYPLAKAEKIRAASGRARYRDFYDIAMIMDSYKMDNGEVLGLVRRKEIRETISQKSILQNWQIAGQEKGESIDQIFYTKEISDEKILASIASIGLFEIKKPA